jgi:hypothetical protein
MYLKNLSKFPSPVPNFGEKFIIYRENPDVYGSAVLKTKSYNPIHTFTEGTIIHIHVVI